MSGEVLGGVVMVVGLNFASGICKQQQSCHRGHQRRPGANDQIIAGLSHPFLGMGPGPMELGKLAAF